MKLIDVEPPGEAMLRAAAPPAEDGAIYGATNRSENVLFRFQPESREVEVLGDAGGYTASMVLDPQEKYAYFASGAHGGQGASVKRLDLKSHEV